MPTKNPRLNITFTPPIAAILSQLAKLERKPLASLANELVLEALELREDISLSALAAIRDVKNARRIKHNEAWK